MPKKPLNKKSAFTLIEFITAVSLIGLVFAAGITAITSIIRFYGTEQAKHRAGDELILALNWIKKDVMQADDITISTDANNHPQLELRITNYADAGHASDTVTYTLLVDNITLRRTTVSGSTTDITNIIDSSSLPQYSSPNPNYLLVQMGTRDADSVASQRMGVMLGCRDDFNGTITRDNDWDDAGVGSRRSCVHAANWGAR